MSRTLSLLVTRYKDAGRFRAVKLIDTEGSPHWAVEAVALKPIYAHLTQVDAEILAGLCNLTDDPDWSTLQPYVDELLPHVELKPNGVQ